MTGSNHKFRGVFLAALLVMSVFAGATAFTGAAVAEAGNDDYDKKLQANETYWSGQDLLIQTSDGTQKTLELQTSDGELVRELKTDSSGYYTLETSDLDGDYKIVNDTGHETPFSVYPQNLKVSTDDGTVTNDNDSDGKEPITIDSRRAEFDLNVSSASLTGAELANITASLGDNRTVYNDGTVHIQNVTYGDYKLDFAGIAAGTYNLTYEVPDTEVTAQNTITVKEASSASASIDKDVYSEQAGDVVEFTVDLKNTDSARVQVGDSEVGYSTNFTVTDNNGDGKVTVLFNTFTAGKSGYVPVATPSDSTDSVNVTDEETLAEPPLDAATYDVNVFVNGAKSDIASISLSERTTVDAKTYIAPSAASIEGVESLKKAVSDGNVVADGDQVIVEVQATGLQGWLNDKQITAADLAKGSAFAKNNGAYVTVVETQGGVNQAPNRLDVSKATLYTAGDNDRFYLVFDSSDFNSNVEYEDAYNATFHVDSRNAYVSSDESNETATAQFKVEKRQISLDNVEGDTLTVNVQDGTGVVSGTTTLAPGSEITIKAEDEGENPFLKSKTITVPADQSFEAKFDFASLDDGTNFTVEATGFDTYDAVLNIPPQGSIKVSDQDLAKSDQTVTVAKAELSEGGFLVVKNANGEVVGTSDYLSAGTNSDVQVSLDTAVESQSLTVIAAQDSDGDKAYSDADKAYTTNGSTVSDTASVTVPTPTPTPTPTETDTPTQTPTPADDSSDDESTPTPQSTSTPGQPGFGLAVSIVALAGAALLAVRRD